MSRANITFIHQLAVDAYGAQHSGGNIKNITTVFALVGLCLANEHGFTGRQVQQAHMKLSKQPSNWPYLEPPKETYDMTVWDVLNAEAGDKRDQMINMWSEAVWKSWTFKHDWVRNICKQLL